MLSIILAKIPDRLQSRHNSLNVLVVSTCAVDARPRDTKDIRLGTSWVSVV